MDEEITGIDLIRTQIKPEIDALHEELKLPWMKLTPSEISEMDINKLQKFKELFRRNIESPESPVLFPALSLMSPTKGKKHYSEDKPALVNSLQTIVLYYLVEAELASRERESPENLDIEQLEKRIKDLEKRM